MSSNIEWPPLKEFFFCNSSHCKVIIIYLFIIIYYNNVKDAIVIVFGIFCNIGIVLRGDSLKVYGFP